MNTRKIALFAVILTAMACPALAGPYDTWAKYRAVTVNTTAGGANVPGEVANFPLLVRLTNASAATGSDVLTDDATGASVRFASADGETAYSYQIERWGAAAAEVWVLVPSIAGSSNTTLRLYWGKDTTSASNPAAVFSTSNGFQAVFHMNEAAGDTIRDATSNGFKGAPVVGAGAGSAAPSPVNSTTSGQYISGAHRDFPGGSGANNTVGGGYRLLTSEGGSTATGLLSFTHTGTNVYTISTWINVDNFASSGTSRRGIITKTNTNLAGNPPTNAQWRLRTLNGANAFEYADNNTNDSSHIVLATNGPVTQVTTAQWNYLTFVRTAVTAPPSPSANIYLHNANGRFRDRFVDSGYTPVKPMNAAQQTGVNVFIGGFAGSNTSTTAPGTGFFDGKLDEVTFSNVARDTNWIKLSYETQKPGATPAVALGETQTQGGEPSVPGAPTGVSGTAGDGQVSVVFTAPSSDGGAAITGYTVTSDPGGFSNTGASSPIVVSGLTNGVGYTFTVVATNSAGTGSASSPSSSVTPVAAAVVPGAPTGVVGTAGDGQVSVAFAAPSSDGGAAITGYTVTSDPGGFSNTGAASPIVVSGLTNGVGYTFTVTATNSVGTGAASSPSSSVTPVAAAVVPGAPTNVVGTAGDGQVSVAFAAPSSDGGAAITGYTVTSDPGGFSNTGAASPIVVSGLTNGVGYTFTVTATNSVGTGSASSPSSSVTPEASTTPYGAWAHSRAIILNTSASGANVTGAVANIPILVRLGSNEAAVFSQAKPGGADIRFSRSGGTQPLAYEIEHWDAGTQRAAIWVLLDNVLGNNASQSITLHWGNAGAGSESDPNAVFSTANGHRAVYHLNDAPGDSARDATSNNYHMQAGTTGSVVPQDTLGVIGVGKNFVGGGTNGNAVGGYYLRTSAASPRLQWTGDQQFTLSVWVYGDSVQGTVSANRRGILGKYTVATTSTQQYLLATIQTPANTATQLRFQGAARNISATGGNFRAVDAEIQQWHHLAYTRTGTATANAVTYLNGVAAFATTGSEGTGATASATPIVIGAYSNLDRFWNGKLDEARFDSTARSANYIKLSYESQRPNQSLTDIGLPGGSPTVPGAPTGVAGTPGGAGSGQVAVNWTAPVSDGGSAITAYTATAATSPGGVSSGTCGWTAGPLTCTVGSLTGGSSYTFTVVATNGVGTGAASAASSPVLVPVGVVPGSVVFRVSGGARPYTFVLPAGSPASDAVTMRITALWGRTVWSGTLRASEEGARALTWNGRSSSGRAVSAGMYVARVTVVRDGKATELSGKGVTLKPQ